MFLNYLISQNKFDLFNRIIIRPCYLITKIHTMTKTSTLLVLLLIGWATTAWSQTLTVTDIESGEPLEQVTLISDNPEAFATTNAKGQVNVSAFEGATLITIRSFGYETLQFSYAQLDSVSFELQLQPSPINIDKVVVSATKWQQPTSDIPVKVISINRKTTTLLNPQTSADLLGASGQVYIQKSQQGGGSPMIRGFATNRLLYTVDGVRMNTAIFRGGNIQNVISLDPFAMENVEVLFGPGSVIYGSDAIGGVMSFQTLIPELSLSDKPLVTGSAVMRYATANNERTGHFDINVGWRKWAFLTSVSANAFDDLKMGSHGPDDYLKTYYVQRQDSMDVVIENPNPEVQVPSGYSQINLMQKLRYKPNEQWNMEYAFHYSETSEYGRYDRNLRTRNGLPRYAEWKYGPQKWLMNHLTVTHTGNNQIYDQMTLRLAHQMFEESRIDRSLNSNERTIRIEEVAAYSVNLDFLKTLGTKNSVTYGVEYVLNDVTSSGIDEDISTGIGVEGSTRYPQSNWQSFALYVTDHFKISEKFSLHAGLRYNHYLLNAQFDTSFYPFPFKEANINNGALTGSFGAVYRPNNSWVLSANFATGFRSPNVDDLGKVFDSEPGAVVIPNPGLIGEYAYNVDLNVTKVFGKWVRVDLTGYYTLLNNALVRRDFTLNGADSIVYDGILSQVQAIQNAAQAKVYGIQATVEIKLPLGFSLSSNLNYQHGEEELDDGSTSTARHAAPMFGVTRLSYKANKLMLQLYAEYQAERSFDDLPEEEKGKTEIYAADDDGNPYAPRWYTLNFKANYQFTQNLSVGAGVENLTDQRYRPYSSGLSGAGRNFIISLKATF